MGCDIHGIIEMKTIKTNHWIGVEQIDLVRNYDYFSKLFGVRNYNEDKPIAYDRGIPKDVSGSSKDGIEYWGEDGHCHTYITLDEIKTVIKPNWNGDNWEQMVGRMEEIYESFDKRDVRLMVWFDN